MSNQAVLRDIAVQTVVAYGTDEYIVTKSSSMLP